MVNLVSFGRQIIGLLIIFHFKAQLRLILHYLLLLLLFILYLFIGLFASNFIKYMVDYMYPYLPNISFKPKSAGLLQADNTKYSKEISTRDARIGK